MLEEIEETTKSGNRFLAAFDGVKSEDVTEAVNKTFWKNYFESPYLRPIGLTSLYEGTR